MKNVSRSKNTSKKVSKLPLVVLLLVVVAVLYMFGSSMSSGKKNNVLSDDQTASASENDTASEGENTTDTGSAAGDESSAEAEPGSEPLTFSFDPPADAETAAQGDSKDDTEKTGDNQSGTQPASAEKEFKVYFLNVGQGDSSLIVCDGHYMLIDGGPGSQSDTVYSFLSSRQINHLDYIVATHPDEDHIGGLSGALNAVTVDKALSSVEEDDSESFKSFVKYLDSQKVNIAVPSAGDTFSLGSASVTVLGPVKPGDNDNNNSLVLRVVHGKNSFLFTGDAEAAEENGIMKSDAEIQSTVLKVGHHGSSASNGAEWLKAVSPSVAVISCGKDNEYGHPAADVLENLKKSGVTVYRTDLQGFLKVNEEEDGHLSFRVEKNSKADVFVPGVEKTAE